MDSVCHLCHLSLESLIKVIAHSRTQWFFGEALTFEKFGKLESTFELSVFRDFCTIAILLYYCVTCSFSTMTEYLT